jgi:hypothetical protein
MAVPHVVQSDYKFKYWISDHAVERFRERMGDDVKSWDDFAVARLLDERLSAAKMTLVIDVDYRGTLPSHSQPSDTYIAEVESRMGGKCFSVMRMVRPNSYPRMRAIGGPGGPALGAITVLTSEMASANFANGRWRVPNRVLGEKLAGVRIVPREDREETEKPVVSPRVIRHEEARQVQIADQRALKEEEEEMNEDDKGRGSTVERFEYAKSVLRARPHINAAGRDGLSDMVREKFGVGMSHGTIQALRQQVLAEQGRQPAPPPSKPELPTSDLAGQLTAAVAAEASAKLALKSAEAAVSQARAKFTEASGLVTDLMGRLQAMRGE